MVTVGRSRGRWNIGCAYWHVGDFLSHEEFMATQVPEMRVRHCWRVRRLADAAKYIYYLVIAAAPYLAPRRRVCALNIRRRQVRHAISRGLLLMRIRRCRWRFSLSAAELFRLRLAISMAAPQPPAATLPI